MYQVSFVYILRYRIPMCSILLKSFAWCEWQTLYSFPRKGWEAYILSSTDRLFSVSWHVRRSKLCLKPPYLHQAEDIPLIYMYIYSHPQTDCFDVSPLFSVAWHARRFKLGSKPTQIYDRLSILPLSQQMTYLSFGIITHILWLSFLYILRYRIPEYSIR